MHPASNSAVTRDSAAVMSRYDLTTRLVGRLTTQPSLAASARPITISGPAANGLRISTCWAAWGWP